MRKWVARCGVKARLSATRGGEWQALSQRVRHGEALPQDKPQARVTEREGMGTCHAVTTATPRSKHTTHKDRHILHRLTACSRLPARPGDRGPVGPLPRPADPEPLCGLTVTRPEAAGLAVPAATGDLGAEAAWVSEPVCSGSMAPAPGGAARPADAMLLLEEMRPFGMKPSSRGERERHEKARQAMSA